MQICKLISIGLLILTLGATSDSFAARKKSAAKTPIEAVQIDGDNAEISVAEAIVPQSLEGAPETAKAEETENEVATEASQAVEAAVTAAVTGDDEQQPVLRQTTAETKSESKATKPLETEFGAAASKPLKESEIPVLGAPREKKAVESTPYSRVFLSFLIIGLLAGGLVYFSKWYSGRSKKSSDTNRIRVLNQHFFGPKKSLAIVRVAGETVLVGITDQNISLLKSLSLLDDELPESTPAQFNQAMDTADARSARPRQTDAKTNHRAAANSADESPDEFLLGHIKDKISSKLKGMRSI